MLNVAQIPRNQLQKTNIRKNVFTHFHFLGYIQPFCLLLDESIDKMDRAQLTMYVCYFDLFTYNPKEEHVSIRKIGTAEMSKTIIWGPKP